jgi:hypothetical protein
MAVRKTQEGANLRRWFKEEWKDVRSGKALWTTTGGRARNAILQAIKACEFQNSCNCKRNVGISKAFTYIREKETGATSRETQES